MDISEDIFQDYLVEKGFKKDEHQLYKNIGDDIVICSFMSSQKYSPVCSFEIIVNSKCESNNYFKKIFDWDEFQSKIKAILRDSRLNDIISKTE